ncbi:MAG TPA: tRNA lysidine(34) synthetase TilS [Gammaproteobacteria bacterium]
MTSNPVIDALRESLELAPPRAPLLVGFSGGLDSHVLLHGLSTLCSAAAAGPLRAVHVHHGLHANADAWQEHCESVCQDLQVPLTVARVDVRDNAQGPEAAARQSRYEAFEAQLARNEILCLAHHENDQAETFLLQLLRGAGPQGLSAMPVYTEFAAGGLLRPLLGASRSGICDYAEQSGLRWVEDASNADLRYDRNYLRHEVAPVLRARWPGAMRTIARAARHQAAIARIANALGDAASLSAAGDGDTLDCAALVRLDRDIATLAVRAWLARGGYSSPTAKLMNRIFDEVIGAGEDANPLVAWRGVEVRRYRGRLHAMAPLAQADVDAVVPWNPPESLELPHGRLEASPATGAGLDAGRCARGGVEVRFRSGGERCRPAGQTQSSTLKHWFQQQGIPPWKRDRVPLIYVDSELAAVAGVWICAGFESAPGEPGWLLRWRSRPPGS